MRELIGEIANIIISSPVRDARRDGVLEKLHVLSLDEERRRLQIINGDAKVSELSIDVRASRLSAALKPIDAFSPREMGQVIVLAARVFSPLARNLDSITEMWKHLPGGRDFRLTHQASWVEEVSIRFDILPYAFKWVPPTSIAQQYDLELATNPLRILSSRRVAKKINAVGFELYEGQSPAFYFESEQDQVLGILSL